MIGEGEMVTLLQPAAAFVAGVVVSLHCVGMCGPLSCAMIGKRPDQSAAAAHGAYHFGRLVSYVALGALAGALGAGLVGWVGANPARYAPWAMMLFFVALALNVDGLLTRWQAKTGFGRSWVQRAYRLPGYSRGLGLGLLTPLIPCGPLYLMLWASTMAGSAAHGAWVMASFAAGTMPLMILAVCGWNVLAGRLRPKTVGYLRRGLALVAVAVLCLRSFLDTSSQAIAAANGLCN